MRERVRIDWFRLSEADALAFSRHELSDSHAARLDTAAAGAPHSAPVGKVRWGMSHSHGPSAWGEDSGVRQGLSPVA